MPSPRTNRQFEGVLPHQGKCTETEIRALQKCNMEGSRPFANLIAAGYAQQNSDTGDWGLTDTGFERIREFNIGNPTKYVV